MDDTHDGDTVEAEGDRYAEHGEQMRVVDGSIQRVYAPCWRVVDEILFRRACAVGFLADESEGGGFVLLDAESYHVCM